MKNSSRFALVATLALSAVAAQAGQNFTCDHFPAQVTTQSTTTRAQVIADYKTTQAAGQLPSDQHFGNYPENTGVQQSTLTRAEVRNETLAELKNGAQNFGG